jgi:rhodanese-related sulfurtransferase
VIGLVLGGGAVVADALRPAEVSAVALAEQIAAGRRPSVVDVRSRADFAVFHIPSASHATIRSLLQLDVPHTAPIVIYADGAARAVHAGTLLRARGYRDVAFVRDGVYEWLTRVHEPQLAVDATPAERADFDHRAALSRYFGGQPHVDVPRAELARGAWTAGPEPSRTPSLQAALLVAAIRRRGC